MVNFCEPLNWGMDSENLYCAFTKGKPEHEMEKALLTLKAKLIGIGIVGPKIETGQINFKIAQVKDNKSFQEKFPESLALIATTCLARTIKDIGIYKATDQKGALHSALKFIEHDSDYNFEGISYEPESYFINYRGIKVQFESERVKKLLERYSNYILKDQKAASGQ